MFKTNLPFQLLINMLSHLSNVKNDFFLSTKTNLHHSTILQLSWFFILLSFTTPLVVINRLIYPYITGKTIFFEACVEGAFALWLLALLLKKVSFFWQKEMTIFPFFLLMLLVINFFSFDNTLAFWSNFERSEGFWLYLHLIVWAFLLYQLQSKARWNIISILVLLTGLLVGISGLLISMTNPETYPILTLERFAGTIGNPSFLAIYMLFLIFLGLNLWVLAKGSFQKICLGILTVFFFMILLGTQNRGTQIGLILGLPPVLIFIKSNTPFKKIISLITVYYLVVLTLVGVVLFLSKEGQISSANYVLGRYINSDTFISRIYNWEIAWYGFLDKKVLGWGLENYTYVFPKYYNAAFHFDNSWYDHPHNVFLGWLVAGGFLGFCAYLVWWVSFVLFIKNSTLLTSQKVIWGGFLLSYGIHSLFLFDNLISFAIFLGLWVYILVTQKENGKPISLSKHHYILIAPLLIFSVASFALVTIRTYQTAQDFLIAYNTTSITDKTEKFSKLYSNAFIGKHDIADIAGFQAIQLNNEADNDAKSAFQSLALEQLNQELRIHPQLGKLLTTKATLLQYRGDFEESIELFEQIKDIAPKRPYSWVSLGQVYSDNRQYDLSLDAYEQAYELNPSNFDPLIYKANVYAKLLDTVLIEKTLKRLPSTVLVTNIQAISQIYKNIAYERGFIKLVNEWADKDPYTKQVYQEWANNAYQISNFEQVATAVYSYHRHTFINSDTDPYLRKLQQTIKLQHLNPNPYFLLDESFWKLHSANLNRAYR